MMPAPTTFRVEVVIRDRYSCDMVASSSSEAIAKAQELYHLRDLDWFEHTGTHAAPDWSAKEVVP